MKAQQEEWRTQVYEGYVHERRIPLAPDTLEGLRSRSYWLKRMVRDLFPESLDAPILEVGCGHGALIYFARSLGYLNIRGVDGSPDQVASARKLGIPGVEQGDAMDALQKQGANSLAALVAVDVIEHFERQEVLDFASESYRVLRPGGCLIMHTVNGSSPFQGDSRYNDITHNLAFTQNSMGQILSASGFRNFSFYEDTPVVHGIKSAARWLGWKVVRALLQAYNAIETGDPGREAIFSRNFTITATK
jgi:SAM-dependent methyltransferase